MTDPELLDDVASPLELPPDRPVRSLAALAREWADRPGIHAIVHAEGCASALLAVALARQGTPQVVVVTPDADGARRAAADLTALAAGLPLPAPHD